MSTHEQQMVEAMQSLGQIDSFHSPDAIEALDAVQTTAEAWKELVLHQPAALAQLLDTSTGRIMMANSIGVVTACVARVIQDLGRQRTTS